MNVFWILLTIAGIILQSRVRRAFRKASGKIYEEEKKNPADELYSRKYDFMKLREQLILLCDQRPLEKPLRLPELESIIRSDAGPIFWDLGYELGFIRIFDDQEIILLIQKRHEEETVLDMISSSPKRIEHYRFKMMLEDSSLILYSDFDKDPAEKQARAKIARLLLGALKI